MINPFEITIQNQAEDERIIKIWRHHPFTLVAPVAKVVAFALIPIALLLITGPSMLGNPVLFVLFMAILGIVITFAAYEWVSWYGDVYILTNYRMIDVEQTGFFHRHFSEATLDNIQDISHTVSGVLQTVFNYGDVLVQTASAVPNIDMNDIGEPQAQSVFLLKEQQKYIEEHDDQMSADQLVTLLAKHGKNLEKLAGLEKEERRKAAEEQLKRETEAKQPKRKKARK